MPLRPELFAVCTHPWAGMAFRFRFLHMDLNLLEILGCLGSPQAQGMQGAARADQLEGPWGVWWQAVKFPVAAWDGHTLFLGYSLLLNVWPKKIVT